jgi:hypothetical protein
LVNGRYGQGGFDLHIVMPPEPIDSDLRTFYFVCHHKEVIFRAKTEEDANHWIDEVHEWAYAFLHEKDNKSNKK